jgi:transcription elongation factor Elf1
MNRTKIKEILGDFLPISEIDEKHAGFNFRCPVCGDSKKSKRKKRAWILIKEDGRPRFFCHNCDLSCSFNNLLKEYFNKTYRKFFSELSARDNDYTAIKSTTAEIIETSEYDKLIKKDLKPIIDDVAFGVYEEVKSLTLKNLQLRVLKYLKSRKIPEKKIKELYISYKDYEENGEIKYYLKNKIIIPYYKDEVVYAFQARTLMDNPDVVKYITIKEENEIKIYNFFEADEDDIALVTEGPIDSWFLRNGLSVSGSVSPHSDVVKLIEKKFGDVIWVFDNHYCDPDGKKKTEKFLWAGKKCYIWTKDLKEHKDVNDVIRDTDITTEEMSERIKNNVYQGKMATVLLKLNT